MEQLIRNITSRLTDKLSDDQPFYTPDDLREYDIPEFLIQRVEVEIYRNLNESIVPPHSEWADMGAAEVELAWEKFIDAIVAEVRMPVSFAPTVFETAIADVLEMILQPRKSIPEILFGPKEDLTAEELEKRVSFISVNMHLASAIQKYMQRKGLSTIGIGTARNVVRRVDERVTSNYNSLNWAQLLNPLFILAGPSIDTELFRIFFRDRNMDRISRRFDLLNGSLTKIEFIETLSSPDLLNEEGYEDDQASLFDISTPDASEHDSESDQGDQSGDSMLKNPENQNLTGAGIGRSTSDLVDIQSSESRVENTDDLNDATNSGSDDHIETPRKDNSGSIRFKSGVDEGVESEESDDTILGSFQSTEETQEMIETRQTPDETLRNKQNGSSEITIADAIDDQTDKNEDTPLYNTFESDEDYEDEGADKEVQEDERFAETFSFGENVDSDEEPGDSVDFDPFDEQKEAGGSGRDIIGSSQKEAVDKSSESEEIEEVGLDDESPIWQSFLSDDEHVEEDDIPEFSAYADIDDKHPENEYKHENEDAPLIDLTQNKNDVKSANQLINWMKDDEERFVSGIFSGSGRAYEEALIDVNQLANWAQASRFIEKEIFARNHVDMYDEVAVDFTDRLQAYFDENKS